MTTAKELKDELNKALGSDVLKLASDPSLVVRYLPTGLLPVDFLLQGGIPCGRATEVFGDYSTLKSYIALCSIAKTQQSGGVCGLVDSEHSFDPSWATSIGVKCNDLLIEQPRTGEGAVDATQLLVSKGVALIVWDSVASMLPQDEAKKRMENENIQPARLASLMSAGLRKITASNSDTALLFINQTRLNIGMTFGNPEVVPGGKALPFYSSYRVSLRKAGRVTEDVKSWDGSKNAIVKETIGQKIRATVEKSKLNRPHRDTYFTYDLVNGCIDEIGWLITVGMEAGVIKRGDGAKWTMTRPVLKATGDKRFRGLVESNAQAMKVLKDLLVSGGETEPPKKRVVRLRLPS